MLDGETNAGNLRASARCGTTAIGPVRLQVPLCTSMFGVGGVLASTDVGLRVCPPDSPSYLSHQRDPAQGAHHIPTQRAGFFWLTAAARMLWCLQQMLFPGAQPPSGTGPVPGALQPPSLGPGVLGPPAGSRLAAGGCSFAHRHRVSRRDRAEVPLQGEDGRWGGTWLQCHQLLWDTSSLVASRRDGERGMHRTPQSTYYLKSRF